MKYDTFIGIDPGATGAIAFLHSDGEVSVHDYQAGITPTELHVVAMTRAIALIERVHSMPKQGVASTFSFGVNFGIWQGRLGALQIPYDFVAPGTWQKEAFRAAPKRFKTVKGIKRVDTKAMSLEAARRRFPEKKAELARKKDNGRADAILIAEYARRLYEKD